MALLIQTVQGGPFIGPSALTGSAALTLVKPTVAGTGTVGTSLNLLSLRPSGWGSSVATTIALMDGSQTPPGAPFSSDSPISGTNGMAMIFHDSVNAGTTNWSKVAVSNPATGGANVWQATRPAGTYGTLGEGTGRGLGNFFAFPDSPATKGHWSCVFRIVTNQADGVLPSGWVHPVSNKWFGVETSGQQFFVQLYEGGYYLRAEDEVAGYYIPPSTGQLTNAALVKDTWYNMEVLIDTGAADSVQVNLNGAGRVDATGMGLSITTFTEMNLRVYMGGGDLGVVANDITYQIAWLRFEWPT